MFVLGDDFAFNNAARTFAQMEKLIKHGNEYGQNYNVSFVMSTPGRYVDALKKENVKWPIKYGDFMNFY